MMTDLIEKLKEIAVQAHESDAPFIEAAIDRIEELEAELNFDQVAIGFNGANRQVTAKLR